MGFADDYLTLNSKTKGLIDTPPARELKAIIIIPCYNEPDIINTLDALHQCEPMSHPHEIIVLINSSENSPDNIIINNKNTLKKIIEWKKSHNITALDAVNITNLPKKQAGAGMARKTAMDEAVYRFNLINQDNGIIISM